MKNPLRINRLLPAFALLAFVMLAAALVPHLIHEASSQAPRAPLSLGGHLLPLMIGLGLGAAASWGINKGIDRFTTHLHRHRALMRIDADFYWETDRHARFTLITDQRRDGMVLHDNPRLDHTVWDAAGSEIEKDVLDAHRADLKARLPFRGLRVAWRDERGELEYWSLSGEPRHVRGRFAGYWGLARVVTTEARAQEALVASERRYHELFDRTPSPLVLHRHGRVLDANPAAVNLLGYRSLPALLGQELLHHYDPDGDRALAAQRIAQLEHMPVGASLPMARFRMFSRKGERLAVRATGVRVDADGSTATLMLYVDDTDRHTHEKVMHRNEALLSHLVATSPDVIAVTELASGRFMMVNDAFVRVLGYSREEAVGRTSIELGAWYRLDDRRKLADALKAHNHVTNLPAIFVAKGGKMVSMLVSAARFSLGGREYAVISGRDVTESERARLAHEAILRNASIGIALTREQRFVQANPRFEQMFGWPEGEMTGQSIRRVWLSESDYAEVRREVGPRLRRGRAVEIERMLTRRDGSTFVCRLLAKAVDPAHPSRVGTIWIAEDVTEKRQIEQKLARARDEAEAASHAKSAFLANMSHEIRTPLNGLLGLARLARQPDIDDTRRRRYLDQIGESAETLSAILSDILDLSKIEAGKLSIEAVPFSLGTLLRSLHHAYGLLAEAHGLELHFDSEPSLPTYVRGDPLRVRQILSNYLNNALKFTERGSVRLVVRRGAQEAGGDMLRFEVHDTGPGIDEATQLRLFQPFIQADDSITRRYGGTGLGLSICRELATLMNGRVGVVSAPGAGSTFWAELPLPATQPGLQPEGQPASEELQSLRGRRILMVEDNPVNMTIGVAMLEQWGMQVEQACDGAAALDAVDRALQAGQPFDMVLMDVHMPVMSGHEAARRLRQQRRTRGLPIIALTAAALGSERELALSAGMDDFLTKPIDPQRLQTALIRALAQARSKD